MTFAIYKHDGQYWKLYHARFVQPGADEYSYGFGGQSCRMVEVEYTRRARSSHLRPLDPDAQLRRLFYVGCDKGQSHNWPGS